MPPDELRWRINDDSVLANVDEASSLALNGPRVTNLFEKLVPPQAWGHFLCILRVLRKWAKARGVWKNKFGYPGGVNYSIMAAYVCQLYPHATCVPPPPFATRLSEPPFRFQPCLYTRFSLPCSLHSY